MSDRLAFTGFFGDAEHRFALTDPMVAELERLTECGVGALYSRIVKQAFKASDLAQIIRLGLIGGGMAPERAAQMVQTYATDRPLGETFPLALDVLDARWFGTPTPETPKEDAAQ